MQFTGKITKIAGKNTRQTQSKMTASLSKNNHIIEGKNSHNCTQNYQQLQAICYHTAGEFTCKLQIS